jgi:hypothetical protein
MEEKVLFLIYFRRCLSKTRTKLKALHTQLTSLIWGAKRAFLCQEFHGKNKYGKNSNKHHLMHIILCIIRKLEDKNI